MILPLLALAVAALPAQWASFARQPFLVHASETVAIGTANSRDGKAFAYRLRLTRESLAGTTTLWTDDRSCPAFREVRETMRDLTMPRPAPYGIPGANDEIVIDGTRYVLDAPSNFSNGTIRITSNIGSPLAAWVDAALSALAPCWSTVER